jgi:hypothetical protein
MPWWKSQFPMPTLLQPMTQACSVAPLQRFRAKRSRRLGQFGSAVRLRKEPQASKLRVSRYKPKASMRDPQVTKLLEREEAARRA